MQAWPETVKRLSDQTADVRNLFLNSWEEDAAARWVFEHNCALGSGYAPQTPSLSDQCPYTEFTGALEARDGTTLIDQPANVQDLFVNTWGSHAAARWVYEHNCGLGPERSPGTTSQSQQSGQADIRLGSALDPTPTPTQSLPPLLTLIPPLTLFLMRPGTDSTLKETSTGVGNGCAMHSWIIESHPLMYTIVATRP